MLISKKNKSLVFILSFLFVSCSEERVNNITTLLEFGKNDSSVYAIIVSSGDKETRIRIEGIGNTIFAVESYENTKEVGKWYYLYPNGKIKAMFSFNSELKPCNKNWNDQFIQYLQYDEFNEPVGIVGIGGFKSCLNGIYESRYLNGEIYCKGEYNNGEKSGTWTYWSLDGTVDRKEYPNLPRD